MSKKLYDFEPVYYITLEDSVERQNQMESQFNLLGIKNYNKIIALDGRKTNYSEDPNIIGPYKFSLDSGQIATILSHIKAIKYWYENSDSPTAIFLEDDIDLTICKYWNFGWNDLLRRLPKKWNVIQLSLIRCDDAEVPLNDDDLCLRRRSFYNWSAGCYMITREYAKKLLSHYVCDEKINLSIYNYDDYFPYIENVLYIAARPEEYTLPLFVEDVTKISTFYPLFSKETHKPGQVHSSGFVYDWWKNNGPLVDLDELMTFRETWYWEK